MYPERAQALAAEIAANDPDIVGLQEAVLLRTDTPADGAASPAENVLADYLDILLQALEAQGAHYAPVAVVTNADNELPTALGSTSVSPTVTSSSRGQISAWPI
jgi:hypothetical protein